jgi:hypothetical protein
LQTIPLSQVVLLVILVINTLVWPHVHQLMTLMSFLSFAVLTLTVAFSILIGDGSAWTLPAVRACEGEKVKGALASQQICRREKGIAGGT